MIYFDEQTNETFKHSKTFSQLLLFPENATFYVEKEIKHLSVIAALV